MTNIIDIKAREILASGGEPSLEVSVYLEDGSLGEASVSYGASAGSKEAFVLFDEGDKNRYNGRGMLIAKANVLEKIKPAVMGMDAMNLRAVDEKMIALDGTDNKMSFGANAILAVSMATARAGANSKKVELYTHLRNLWNISGEIKLPKPMIVMIEGGKHADNSTDLQEFMVSAMGNKSAAENVRMEMEIYKALKSILKAEGLSTNVGNEGAFAPNGIKSNEAPLEYFMKAVEKAGYKAGVDVGFSIDAAASELYNYELKNYELRIENKTLTSAEMIEYLRPWTEKYPIVTMEDMLSEFDWENWPKLVENFGDKITIIADDLTVTNTKLWQKAIDVKAANAILIKLNQAGTVTETMNCCMLARQNNFATVPSHRGGGETNDTFLVDLAVAVGSAYIKVGPTRGERVCKYNRLMRIEEILNLPVTA